MLLDWAWLSRLKSSRVAVAIGDFEEADCGVETSRIHLSQAAKLSHRAGPPLLDCRRSFDRLSQTAFLVGLGSMGDSETAGRGRLRPLLPLGHRRNHQSSHSMALGRRSWEPLRLLPHRVSLREAPNPMIARPCNSPSRASITDGAGGMRKIHTATMHSPLIAPKQPEARIQLAALGGKAVEPIHSRAATDDPRKVHTRINGRVSAICSSKYKTMPTPMEDTAKTIQSK